MGIDFITLIAQLINLGILIWLLKRFLYRPILNMLTERQKLIDAEIIKARKARKEAENQEAIYQKRVADFDAKRSGMLFEVQKQADELREKLTNEAKQAIAYSRKNWQQDLLQEKKSFDDGLQNAVVKNFKLFASDALKDMAGVDLNDLVLNKFKEKVSALSVSARKKFTLNAQNVQKIVVSTDTVLTSDAKADLKEFLITVFDLSDEVKFTFKKDENLLCGVEIKVGEQVTSWNLQNYLTAFENNMDAAFNELIHQGS